jgi:hypothetical protein
MARTLAPTDYCTTTVTELVATALEPSVQFSIKVVVVARGAVVVEPAGFPAPTGEPSGADTLQVVTPTADHESRTEELASVDTGKATMPAAGTGGMLAPGAGVGVGVIGIVGGTVAGGGF